MFFLLVTKKKSHEILQKNISFIIYHITKKKVEGGKKL